MNWISIALIIILVLIASLIIYTLYRLLPLGDERIRMIQLEAGAYSFSVVIVYLLIEIASMAYTNLATNKTFENMNPLITIIIFSIIYLFSLLRSKRKYS